MNVKLRKLVTCAVICTLAVISFTIENLLPPLFLPGARIGISNVFILLSAILLGSAYGYATLIVKVILGSIFSGNFSAVIYALPSGLVSLTVELILLFVVKKFSIIACSIFGACINSTLQNLTFCLITGYAEYLCYLPYLALIGVIGGFIVGLIVYLLVRKINFSFLSTRVDKNIN